MVLLALTLAQLSLMGLGGGILWKSWRDLRRSRQKRFDEHERKCWQIVNGPKVTLGDVRVAQASARAHLAKLLQLAAEAEAAEGWDDCCDANDKQLHGLLRYLGELQNIRNLKRVRDAQSLGVVDYTLIRPPL